MAVELAFVPWNGTASVAARWLGSLVERNWEFCVVVTLDRDGRPRVASSGITIHRTRTGQRNRIDARARVSSTGRLRVTI
jgi:hypothetical protein